MMHTKGPYTIGVVVSTERYTLYEVACKAIDGKFFVFP